MQYVLQAVCMAAISCARCNVWCRESGAVAHAHERACHDVSATRGCMSCHGVSRSLSCQKRASVTLLWSSVM